jgi:DNA-binding NtrC family response regulator
MTLRRLLSICVGDTAHWDGEGKLANSIHSDTTDTTDTLAGHWDLTQASSLVEARKALKIQFFPVGVLLIQDTQETTLDTLTSFLDGQQSTQWVGVFPPVLLKTPRCKALIAQHLFDFHTWPIDTLRLKHTLGHAYGYADLVEQPHVALSSPRDMDLVGHGPAIAHLRSQIRKVAQASAPVLIWGESGSGKELTALAIHRHSPRAKAPFIAVNCGAIPASLIQSELFGYERGAFTGAAKEKKGLIEAAAQGTLFLDEVGDLPLELQANLLRFLQEGTINRVGSSTPILVDARVIAASHIHLQDAVKAGNFREDLLYRLNVLPLNVPALRERKEDLPLLAKHFFKAFENDKNPRITGFSQRALQAIKSHDWPGNVRELINRIRRALVMAEGRLITPEDLGLSLPAPSALRNGEALEEARVRAERDAINVCLQGSGSNVTRAARDLGVSRMTLYRLMEKHGIHA